MGLRDMFPKKPFWRRKMKRLANVLIPLPKKIEQGEGYFKVADFCGKVRVTLNCSCDVVDEAKAWILKKLRDEALIEECECDGVFTVNIKVDPACPELSEVNTEEGYIIRTYEGGADLIGKGDGGAFYAAVTFADMLEVNNSSVSVPEAYIFDFPDFPFRGELMECRWGSEYMTKEDYFKAIDYFVSQKHNRVNINLYCCWGPQFDEEAAGNLFIPVPGYPEAKKYHNKKYYSVKERRWVKEDNLLAPMFEQDFLGEVMAYAKRKNMRVLTTINSLGHNRILPKHIPEIASVDVNGKPKIGGFCTTNPKTYEVMFSIYDKIIDKYLAPNGLTEFCIGLDEVSDNDRCQCPRCRERDPVELQLEYMETMLKHLKEKGMTSTRVSFDMLHSFGKLTPEYRAELDAKGIGDMVDISWWSYTDTPNIFRGDPDKVNNIFRGTMKPYSGYMNWDITPDSQLNIRGCVKLAKEKGLDRVEPYGMFDPAFDKNFATVADIVWNTNEIDKMEEFNLRYAERYYPNDRLRAMEAFDNMFEVMRDETINNYMNRAMRWMTYYMYCYRSIHNEDLMKGITTFKFKNFPGEAFDRLNRSDRIDFAYLTRHHRMAKNALDFFENSGRHDEFNDAWILNAKHYYVLADEYIGLWGRYREYNDGIIDAYAVIAEFERVIKQREELMAFVEETKFRPNSYTMLRQMSVFRQYFIDVRDYLKREVASGNARPKLDMTNIEDIVSPMFRSLR